MKCSWSKLEKLVGKLEKQIKKDYVLIIGLNRGGLIPGVLLSHALDVRHGVTTIQSYNKSNKQDKIKSDKYVSMIGRLDRNSSILIVDDIADSGTTLKEAYEWLECSGFDMKKVDTATLYYKKRSKFKPTYYAEKIKDKEWVQLPWER